MNYWKRDISNPIRSLTLDRLASQIDAYQNGYLAEFALTADAMEQRDDMLKNVITKRKKAVTRHGWEILVEDCSDEARAQRDALDYFYRNLTCTHALRPNERGGFQLLIYQMMDAVGKGYAVHEILWKPTIARVGRRRARSANPLTVPECGAEFVSLNSTLNTNHSKLTTSSRGGANLPVSRNIAASSSSSLSTLNTCAQSARAITRTGVPSTAVPSVTASFRFVPLWYFEATTGHLRFLTTPGALHGQPMAERDWLVTTGDALMIACSRAFLFKHYPLQAWLDFSEKFGLPGVRAITSAARGTPEFAEMEDALQSFMKELSVVTNTAESIDVIDLKGAGQPPFAELVERMDRVMASLWRGADLSTLSRDRGYGATLQEQESRILELDDARALSEHLNSTLDRWVLAQLFGPDVTPLARVKILVTPQECTPHDLAIDQFLIAHGARLPLSQTLERYGRVQAKPDEPSLSLESSPNPKRSKTQHPALSTHHLNDGRATLPRSRDPAAPSLPSENSSFEIRHSKLSPSLNTCVRSTQAITRTDVHSTLNKPMTTKLHNSTTPQSSPIAPNPDSGTEKVGRRSCGAESAHHPTSSSPQCPPLPPVHPVQNGTASLSNQSEIGDRKSEIAATQPLDDFIQLSPLGLFPHRNGFQNVDRTALENMVKNFKSFFGRLGRRFAGLPFYIGHPDVPGYENVYSDRKAYGWIMDLEVREDGLYGRTNWSAAGRELIANGHYKFLSPYWEAIRIGERNGRGVFSPTVLKSVGLTNEPNLPVLPLANTESGRTEDSACLGTSLSLFDVPPLNLPQFAERTSHTGQHSSGGLGKPNLTPNLSNPGGTQNGGTQPQSGSSLNRTDLGVASLSPTDTASDHPSNSETSNPLLPNSAKSLDEENKTGTPNNGTQGPRPSAIDNSKSAAAPQPAADISLKSDISNHRSENPSPSLSSSQSSLSNSQSDLEKVGRRSCGADFPQVADHSTLNSQHSTASLAHLEQSLANCEREIAALNHRLITTLLDNAIAGARILPIERPHWGNALHQNFEETSAALANAAPKLNLTSRTESLPRLNAPLPPDQKQKRILTLVHERMRSTNSTFHQAWLDIRSDHPSLFTS